MVGYKEAENPIKEVVARNPKKSVTIMNNCSFPAWRCSHFCAREVSRLNEATRSRFKCDFM